MATEHKMWAVVASDLSYETPILSVEKTKQAAKNTALSFCEPSAKWAYARDSLGWRVVPVTVTVPDEEER